MSFLKILTTVWKYVKDAGVLNEHSLILKNQKISS